MRSLLAPFPRTIAAAALSVALLAGACATPDVISGPQFVTREGKAALQRVYRLGIGDKLKITVYGEDNLSGPAEVNALGQVSLPLIGEMPAQGLALQEFRDSIARRLADGYIKNPKVTVEMTNYRPIYVHGEVKNGGEFQFKNGVSMRDAVAMAGGYTYRADQSYVYIGREGEPEVAVSMPADVPVLPGDNIRIPERFF
ncbi:MAG TPA: polysaccharide biosynthesis/export family protein [Hyphomicrobium sp.]|nr:polysaccharide biosynthesis/export family protein [Hyphomicrobium sp.]